MLRALLASSLLVSCTHSHSPSSDEIPVCTNTRRVGIAVGQSSCPAARGQWTGEPLFAEASIRSRAGDPICLYEFTGARFTTRGLPSISYDIDGDGRADRVSGAEWTDGDCLAVHELSAPGELIAPSQTATFHAQADRVTAFPTASFAPVTVGVLDSAQTQTTPRDRVVARRNPHGELVAELARDLACDDAGRCAINFVSTQVLTEYDDRLGYISQLAQGIAETTSRAQVLNLSVGLASPIHDD